MFLNEGKSTSSTRTATIQDMETKASKNRSRSSSSSLSKATETSPRPIQTDSVRSRSMKTDSDTFNCYYKHYCYFGYSCYSGYLDCIMQSKLKNSGSYKHVPMNIWDGFYPFISLLLDTDRFYCKICSSIYVGYSDVVVVRRSYFDMGFGYGKIELIGKIWWRYYNLCECLMILNYLRNCKVSDFLNRVYQYQYI